MKFGAMDCMCARRTDLVMAMRFLLFTLVLALCLPAQCQLVLSEFMASNTRSLADEDGSDEDWIEIYNNSSSPVNLMNWALTDNAGNLTKWLFPATNLGPRGFILVFASNKNRRAPGAPLHTNFRLDGAGEYLGLVRPDGLTIESRYAPKYPAQIPDAAYGFGTEFASKIVVRTGDVARVLVPLNEASGSDWIAPSFNDSAWMPGPGAIGFNSGSTVPTIVRPDELQVRFNFDQAPANKVIADSRPAGTKHPGTNQGAVFLASARDTAAPPVTRTGVMNFATNGTTRSQIVLPPSPDFDSIEGTLCFWMRTAGTVGTNVGGACLVDRRSIAGAVIVQRDDGRLAVEASDETGRVRSEVTSDRSIADNRWHHVAVVYDRAEQGTMGIYVDGQLELLAASDGPWGWNPAQPIELGRSHHARWKQFGGQLDDFRIYSRILDPAEIALLANNEVSLLSYPDIRTDLGAAMKGQSSSVYLRYSFQLTNIANIGRLRLRLRYDDGFVAFLNGTRIASANAPEPPTWNSTATDVHQAGHAKVFEEFNVTDARYALRLGSNVLALQGLNFSVSDGNCLLDPQLELETLGALSATPQYFVLPTPGNPNGIGSIDLGPILSEVSHTPELPGDADSVYVRTRVTPSFGAITNVSLTYRIMYGPEVTVAMADDGLHGDGLANDALFGAIIPATLSTNGQMIRYFVTASDAAGHRSRWPLFGDPLGSPEYLGTVVSNPRVTSHLPIYQLFVKTILAADSEAGTRCSIYYDGEFYDNAYIRLKGGTSRDLTKKSHRVDFNKEHTFRYDDTGRRLREIAFNAEYVDPSYIRQNLSFETHTRGGTEAPVHFPARLQVNGAFHQLIFPNETFDAEMLERQGFDPDGALYKGALMLNIIGEPAIGGRNLMEGEKQTRLYEDDSDLRALGIGLAETNSVANRRLYLFDNIDVPAIINYLALSTITQQGVAGAANNFPYRDSNNTLEWNLRPWDLNISFGMVYSGPTIAATNDAVEFTHPFYGSNAYRYPSIEWVFSRMCDAFILVPETKAMFLRRLRTLMEELLQPPETHPALLKFENRINQLRERIRPEATLDRAKWGWDGGINLLGNLSFDAALDQMIRQYIVPRRQHLFVTHNIDSSNPKSARIPHSQPAEAIIEISAVEASPASHNQAEEFIQLINTNSYSVDITGWQLKGAVSFTFRPGTVLPTNGTLYVSPNVRAFRQRTRSPHSGESRFVQGPYRGQLSARGGTLTLSDRAGRLAASQAFAGKPSLPQQFLRITEIQYNPAPFPGSTADPQDFEYLELQNISTDTALDLGGVHFGDGLVFDFTQSAVTHLAPGSRVIVVRNAAQFAARYGTHRPVAGQYVGSLDSNGERLVLLDAANEEIMAFSYHRSWHPITDGFGFALTLIDPTASPDSWTMPTSWRPSGVAGGSPGEADAAPPTLAPIVINEVIAHPGGTVSSDAIELSNPTSLPVDISGWFLTDDFRTPRKFKVRAGTTLAPSGYRVFGEDDFNRTPGVPPSFGLSSNGDEVWLFSADVAGNLTGYLTGGAFGAAEAGVSFGHRLNATGEAEFVALSTPTLGASNAPPRVGPVVIAEVMYHPVDTLEGLDNTADEFVELRNITPLPVPLSHPLDSNLTWRLAGGIRFSFPAGVTLSPTSSLLLVNFNPTNSAQADAFRSKYGMPVTVPLYGPYGGVLGNGADEIDLLQPDATATVSIPWVRVDRVRYEDQAPWPELADGLGASLKRRRLDQFGDEAENWQAATPGTGRVPGGEEPPQITLQPVSHDGVLSQTTTFTAAAIGSEPLRYQWFHDGVPISGATGSALTLAGLKVEAGGAYSVAVFNGVGAALSRNATLNVLLTAFFTQQPQSVGTRLGSNVTFSVKAGSKYPLRYQWRFNGVDIPNATNTSYLRPNIALADGGVYTVVLTDEIAPVLSNPATLTVLVDPVFVASPVSQSVPTGGAVVLSAQVSSTATLPLLFRWRKNNIVFTQQTLNAPLSYLLLTNVQGSSTYDVVVSNPANTVGIRSPVATVVAVSDFDHDGIPDTWEASYQLNTNSLADAQSDPDGDHMSNLDEYIAGTDPLDPLSYLSIGWTNVSGSPTLMFQAVANRTYQLEFTDHLGDGVWPRLTDVAARAISGPVLVPDRGLRTNRYYRVITPRKP